MQENTGFDIPQAADNLEISPDLYKRLARLFLDDTETQIGNLEVAIEHKDNDEIARIAHHIAGSAENLELSALGNAARRLMREGSPNEETGSVDSHYRELRRNFRDFQGKLQPHV